MKFRDAKNTMFLVYVSLFFFLFTGCGTANNTAPSGTTTQNPTISTSAASTTSAASQPTTSVSAPTSSATDVKRDDELTDQLVKEKEVLSGQIYFSGDLVICAMVIKNTVKEADGKKIAQKYADELKQKYKGKQINVQAVLNGKNIANINY